MSRLEKILLFVNFLVYFLLAVFSYSYVDLNLTLSQNQIALSFIKYMQQLGYYDRPLATLIYLVFLIVVFSLFIGELFLFKKNKLSLKFLKFSLVGNSLLLTFAYTFLSYDVFNYLFDARIIFKYHLSPYLNRPMDFPGDEWLRFMRWVHRYSPYGPLWLFGSLIPYALGFGKFILILFSFKIFIASFHLINTYLIYQTVGRMNKTNRLFSTAFYALNPLFLIEGIANAHNDVVFLAFIIAPIYFLVLNKKILAYISLFIGGLTKYISFLLLPFYVWFQVKNKKNYKHLVLINIAVFSVFTVVYSTVGIKVPFVSSGSIQTQFQPWYLFWTVPFVAFIPEVSLAAVAVTLCIGASLRYLPNLYYGDWSQPGTIQFMQIVTVLPFTICTIVILIKNHSKINLPFLKNLLNE